MSDYRPGSRWKSAVCAGEFVVVRPPSGEGELGCGGAALRLQTDTAEPSVKWHPVTMADHSRRLVSVSSDCGGRCFLPIAARGTT